MELTNEEQNKVRIIKTLALEHLTQWHDNRERIVCDLEGFELQEVVRTIFRIADELTDMIMRVMDINHQIAPEIIAVLSATVLGITKGNVIKELEGFMKVKDTVNSELH